MTEGFAAIPNWLIRDTEVSVYAIAVYAALASHSGRGGIRPSHATLAREARCSERKVRDALHELRDVGAIESRADWRDNGGQSSNHYFLTPSGPNPPAHGATPPRQDVPTPPAHGADEEEPPKNNPLKNTPIAPKGAESAVAELTPSQQYARRLCERLANWIGHNDPDHLKPAVTSAWLADMERMLRIDGRHPDTAVAVLDWSQRDPFWLKNIKSPAKLRKNYARLYQGMTEKRARATDRGRDVDDELRRRAEARNGGAPSTHSQLTR